MQVRNSNISLSLLASIFGGIRGKPHWTDLKENCIPVWSLRHNNLWNFVGWLCGVGSGQRSHCDDIVCCSVVQERPDPADVSEDHYDRILDIPAYLQLLYADVPPARDDSFQEPSAHPVDDGHFTHLWVAIGRVGPVSSQPRLYARDRNFTRNIFCQKHFLLFRARCICDKEIVWSVSYACVIITRCSAIAERPRCRVRYSFRQK